MNRNSQTPTSTNTTKSMGIADTMSSMFQPPAIFGLTNTIVNNNAGPAIRRQLSRSENAEFKSYNEIHFVPAKKFSLRGVKNGGHDDDNSRYLTSVGDHIAYRYEIQTKLGKGAFGDVYQVYDHKTESRRALKIIRNEHRFNVQGKVEVEVLEKLRMHNPKYNYVKMLESFVFRGHLCLTFELHSHDLYSELKIRDFVGLSVGDICGITANIVMCLQLTKKLNIVHADLKPENILLADEDSFTVKVIDFGSSCFKHGRIHTYVQSRYYRAPEIVLGMGYGCPVDMWSLGCIMVELLTGRPLFAAKNERDLVLYMMEVLGLPESHLLDRAQRTSEFFSKTGLRSNSSTAATPRQKYCSLRVVDRRGRRREPSTVDLASAMLHTDDDMIDFVRKCLTWDPAARLTPADALGHPFLQQQPAVKRLRTIGGTMSPLLTSGSSDMGSTVSLNDSGLESVTSILSMCSDE